MARTAYSRDVRGRFPPVLISTIVVGSVAAVLEIWTDSSIEFIRASVLILTIAIALWIRLTREHRSARLEERLSFEDTASATPKRRDYE